MITAIAIDDEPKAIHVIEHHVSKIDNLELISNFHNANDAITNVTGFSIVWFDAATGGNIVTSPTLNTVFL